MLNVYNADDITHVIERRIQFAFRQCSLLDNETMNVEPEEVDVHNVERWRNRVGRTLLQYLNDCIHVQRSVDVLSTLGFSWNHRHGNGDIEILDHQTLIYFDLPSWSQPEKMQQRFWDPNGGSLYAKVNQNVTAINRYDLMRNTPIDGARFETHGHSFNGCPRAFPKRIPAGKDLQGVVEAGQREQGMCTYLVTLLFVVCTSDAHRCWCESGPSVSITTTCKPLIRRCSRF